MKKQKKMENNVSNATIGRLTHPVVSTSGFCDGPGPPSIRQCAWYVPAYRQGQQNSLQVWYLFVDFFLHVILLSAREIQREYLPDDGIQCLRMKPCGHPLLGGGIRGVVPAHHLDHQEENRSAGGAFARR
jgi:hypothetical protein